MKHRFLSGFLAAAMMASSFFTAMPSMTAYAAGSEVTAEIKGSQIVIGNDQITRTFDWTDQKLTTTEIHNKRANTVFVPGAGSEEFRVRVTKDPDAPAAPLHPALNRDGWTAEATSRQNAAGPSDGPAQNLLDGDLDSIWHTNYGGGEGPQAYPHSVIVDMKKDVTFQCFSYTPRQQGEDTNGNILGYQLWTTDNAAAGMEDASWVKQAEGTFKYNDVAPIYVNLREAVTARKVKLVAVSAKNGQKFAGGAEFNLHAEPYAEAGKCDREFAASELTLQGAPQITQAAGKPGKMVTFTFAPFTFQGVSYTITENVVMYNGDHFMRKFLTISVPQDQTAQAAIDYIDLESMQVPQDAPQWTVPHAGGIVGMEEFKANLGQPIYVQGMFFGAEFPETDNQIADGTGYIRYYSGKNFDQLKRDNQLVQGTSNTYMTWQTVAGAARSTEMQVIQADFFEYIRSIAQPSNFRLQYNSWFDNMMLIDDASIWKSFIEVDRELNQVEMRPMDSYVADDGWNNYNDGRIVDEARSGNTLNKTGFWEFNSKFPNEFYPASELVQNFGSSFGTWVGPRGGYNFNNDLGNILTKSGKGSNAGGAADVADRVYLQHFENMAKEFQHKFGINYWKWDGFADGSQYGAFPAKDGVPGYDHHHMTGGYHHMYHVTDLWEGWTDLIENVRAQATEEQIHDLWISLTCYTNPSPWFLQWGNSVWLQCTADQRNASFGNSHLDKQMTYRDAMYYDFLKNHQFQFPLSNLYNHDPVYGVEGTGMNMNTATDENFQNYLYMMSTRGNAFWELHYSDKIMTPGKYEVTSEFAHWAEENFHMLRNAKIIGGMPDVTHLDNFDSNQSQADAYGYACFDGTDGIISLRNPTVNGAKEIAFTFDRTLGVAEDCGELLYHVEHSYNAPASEPTTGKLVYGQNYSFTLQPNEVLILRVSQTGDVEAPSILRAYTDGKNTVTVKFSEKVVGNAITIAGKQATVAKSADGITYHLTVEDGLTDGETLQITAADISDLNGNALDVNTISTKFYQDNLAAESGAGNGASLGNVDLSDDGFTLHAVADGAQGVLLRQGDVTELGVNAAGKAYFKMGAATAESKTAVGTGTHSITGVKENNGILKIYVDGQLKGSAYAEENRYMPLGEAEVTAGHVESAAVYTAGLGYDAVSKLCEPEQEAVLDPAGMTVTGLNSDPGEGSVNNLFDGDAKTFWASAPSDTKIQKANPNVTIDLKQEYVLTGIDYTQRYDNGAKWSCTGNLKNVIVEVSMDGEHWTEAKMQETVDGTTQVRFDAVNAKYVRISGTKSYHWQSNKADTVMAVGDLKLYGTAPAPAENLALNKTVVARKTQGDTPANFVNPDRPETMAVDGIKENCDANHLGFGEDNKSYSSYAQADLGKICELSEIQLYRYWNDNRTYQNTLIAVSETEDFTNPVILFNADKDDVHGFGAGKDAAYVETAQGHTFDAKNTRARYVRIYMNGSSSGTTNHIVELEVYGKVSENQKPQVDEAVQAVVQQIDAIGQVTLESEQAIHEARQAYEALTDAQKAKVSNLPKLEEAERALAALQANAADKAAAQKVMTKIDAIGEVTLASEFAITDARAAYNKLTDTQKALVTNLNKLDDAEAKLAELKTAEADKAAAKKVEDQINAIGKVSLSSEKEIQAARAAYDKLTDAQKALVPNLVKLAAAEKALADLQAAEADKTAAKKVEDQINAIGKVTLDSEKSITAARAAYDALTDAQKALVSNLNKLEAAEKALADLKDAAAQAEADKKAAKAVEDQINAIGKVTLESEKSIQAARAAYDKLTDAQKALVPNRNKLEAAEKALADLKATEADKAAAKKVADQIDAIGQVTLDSAKAIADARAAYDALTDTQKALVGNTDKLIAAEKALADLQKPVEPTPTPVVPETTPAPVAPAPGSTTTGDSTNLMLWTLLAVVSCGAALTLQKKRSR